MFYYSISIQFAKADAPKFTDISALIDEAIKNYNAKSLMAANPKQIVEKIQKDDITLEIILESTQELQEAMASKALRVFSSYLINDEIDNNLSGYITGKRLFKMLPSRLDTYISQNDINQITKVNDSKNETIKREGNSEDGTYVDELDIIEKMTCLLKNARSNMTSKMYVVRIYHMLIEEEKRCN